MMRTRVKLNVYQIHMIVNHDSLCGALIIIINLDNFPVELRALHLRRAVKALPLALLGVLRGGLAREQFVRAALRGLRGPVFFFLLSTLPLYYNIAVFF